MGCVSLTGGGEGVDAVAKLKMFNFFFCFFLQTTFGQPSTIIIVGFNLLQQAGQSSPQTRAYMLSLDQSDTSAVLRTPGFFFFLQLSTAEGPLVSDMLSQSTDSGGGVDWCVLCI